MGFDLIKLFQLAAFDEEEQLKRKILLRIILLTVFFGMVWGVFYIFLGLLIPALVPIIYGILSMMNMGQYYFLKKYDLFRMTQLILILLLPTSMQLSLGSFYNSSAVVLSAVLCPMGALMFHSIRVARIFFALFMVTVVISGLYAAFVHTSFEVNSTISNIFFVSNIIVICIIIFVLMEYFVGKKNMIQTVLIQKNKDILDSITYAKRIQQAILPSDRTIGSMFPECFVLYKPKDIVSGDFYWTAHWGDHYLFAAVDCTGHGVPGAFMSIVGQNLLNQAVNEHGLSKPSLILNALNKGVSRTLGNEGESQIRDGMDIALCSLNKKTGILEFAGAFNPLWILRDDKMIEIKGNKFPIGSFVDQAARNFDNHEIQVRQGDIIYIFTDGYADQFGGPKGKKFKYKNLEKLLIDIRKEPLHRQKDILNTTIENWKGNMEQIDDILIFGVKIVLNNKQLS